jgi:TonB family protein
VCSSDLAVAVCLVVLGAVLIQGMHAPPEQEITRATLSETVTPYKLTREKPLPPPPPPIRSEPTVYTSMEAERLVPRIHLLVTGEPEAGKVLTFFLHPFEKQYRYHIYFGDGSKQVAVARNRHLYQEPGNYRIRVVVLDRRDTLNDQTFSLYIRPTTPATAQAQAPIQPRRPASGGIMPRDQGGEPAPEEAAQGEVKIFDHGDWESATKDQPLQPRIVAEEMPSFPGGMPALQRFLQRNLDYPADARRQKLEGKVVVQFVVEADGQLSDIQFVEELGSGCEEAVLHALALMPRWIPGREAGQPVPVYYVLPVSFQLD